MAIVDVGEWLEDDGLLLLESWSRDGYSLGDISNRIGISSSTLTKWRKKYPEVNKALKQGREIVDYKVENALLKSALGYKTKEVKVITTMRNGKVTEVVKETTDKEQSPNVYAIQCWLFNRLPDKWKRNRDSIIEQGDEDTTIKVTVERASEKKHEDSDGREMNKSISIRNKTKEEIEAEREVKTEILPDESEDLDFWPDDWEDK